MRICSCRMRGVHGLHAPPSLCGPIASNVVFAHCSSQLCCAERLLNPIMLDDAIKARRTWRGFSSILVCHLSVQWLPRGTATLHSHLCAIALISTPLSLRRICICPAYLFVVAAVVCTFYHLILREKYPICSSFQCSHFPPSPAYP